ncbi:MAG: hypothetical protein NC131_00855 [Roseburia sp.]|nr:hypothetical protein [Roseburia sp.]
MGDIKSTAGQFRQCAKSTLDKAKRNNNSKKTLTKDDFISICYTLLGEDFFALIDATMLGSLFEQWGRDPAGTAQALSETLHGAIHSSIERRNSPFDWKDEEYQ